MFEELDRGDKIGYSIIIVLLFLVAFLVGNGIYYYLSTETITIEGEVINAETHINDNGNIEYITLHFTNGQDYDVEFLEEAVDFTVNSKIVLEMYKSESFFGEDKYWKLNHVIKVPELE